MGSDKTHGAGTDGARATRAEHAGPTMTLKAFAEANDLNYATVRQHASRGKLQTEDGRVTEQAGKAYLAGRTSARDPLAKLRMPGYPKAPDPDAMDAINPVSNKRYTSDGARTGDGLPDTNVLIGRMPQDDIDKILSKIDTHPSHGKGEKSRV